MNAVGMWVAFAAALEGLLLWLVVPWLVTGPVTNVAMDVPYAWLLIRSYIVMMAAFVASFGLVPSVSSLVSRVCRGWSTRRTLAVLACFCAVQFLFVLHAGRTQFGAFDYNVLVDTGWRQIQGQRPYVDFLTTTPPGFILGIRYAYELFGVSWDAGLYFAGVFVCLSFLWTYWLLRELTLGRLASMLVALAVESSAMLILCFWWYNDSAIVMATLFLLSCTLCARQARELRWSAQLSFVVSLMLLLLMKPNVAGVALAGGLFFLLLCSPRKIRLLLLTCFGVVGSGLLLLANHVSPAALFMAYRAAAKERGGLNTFGFDQMNNLQLTDVSVWGALLAIPMLYLLPGMLRDLRTGRWRGICFALLFWVAPVVSVYALATNGEFREVEWAVLMGLGSVLAFGLRVPGPFLRRTYIAILCAATAANLYLGAARARTYTIGPHLFFEWSNNAVIKEGFLKNLRASSTLVEVEREVKQARGEAQGTIFFGPRVDFNYAALALPSPRNLPVWWHPGTSFARSNEHSLVQAWQAHHFDTLIFLKGDYTYYPPDLLAIIHTLYTEDDRYPLLTVYRRN